jgi:hypothetical protein
MDKQKVLLYPKHNVLELLHSTEEGLSGSNHQE